MEDLSTPSRELALSIEREVGLEERLTAGCLHPRSGVKVVDLYSVKEVFALLGEPFPQVDLSELEGWVRTVIGDAELAARIRFFSLRPGTAQERLLNIRDLLGLRLIQCRQAAESV